MILKENIKNSFSKAAKTYDNYAFIQRNIAEKLISFINQEDKYKKIVELGCGTGCYSGFLRKRFLDSAILSIDISQEMTDIASKKNPSIQCINADIETLALDFFDDFDFITSNSVIHWLNNPFYFIKRFNEIRKLPKCLLFSIFGNNTLAELSKFIQEPLISVSFHSKNEWEFFLQDNFPDNFTLIPETSHKTYPDLISLLRSLKYTGVNVKDNNKFIWSRKLIKETEKKIISEFNEIRVSYEVFFVKINLSPSRSS